MVSRAEFDRRICFDDLATGGSIMVFGAHRNVIEIVAGFLRFFVHESCGYCTPCRVGNVLLLERVEKFLSGACDSTDIEYLRSLAETIRATSRCGLGQTAPNPVITALESFPDAFREAAHDTAQLERPGFDVNRALSVAEQLTGRESVYFARSGEDG
jgi:[NiFe] hydrogenase diaphorase moiety large subunit